MQILHCLSFVEVFFALLCLLFLFFHSMARTKITPKKEREGRTVLCTKAERAKIAKKAREEKIEKEKGPPSPVHHPSPAKQPSPMREVEQAMDEAERQVEEARWLEEVGRSPSSLPTQQLAQMAAEAGPSVLGEEPAARKLCPTMGGKAPQKEFLKAGKVKKPRKYQPGTVALCMRSGSFKRALSS